MSGENIHKVHAARHCYERLFDWLAAWWYDKVSTYVTAFAPAPILILWSYYLETQWFWYQAAYFRHVFPTCVDAARQSMPQAMSPDPIMDCAEYAQTGANGYARLLIYVLHFMAVWAVFTLFSDHLQVNRQDVLARVFRDISLASGTLALVALASLLVLIAVGYFGLVGMPTFSAPIST